MRLVTINDGCPKCRRAGLLTERGIVDLPKAWRRLQGDGAPRGVLDLLRENLLGELAALDLRKLPAGALLPATTPLWAPVDRPGKILCLGLNFRSHAVEGGRPAPTLPIIFAKATTALTGPTGDIQIPPGTAQVDWEAELCLVIGREARRVSAAEALDYVAGFTVMNDVSARDWQFAVSQFHRGKSADTFAPLGPALVTPDERHAAWGGATLREAWSQLRLLCRVNGETMQDSRLAGDLIFQPAELISYISQSETLEVGDCLSLGTPAGVGHFRKPPRYLRPGDVVECEIPGLGLLRNQVVAS